jgi:hypothetical protein
MVEQNTLIQIGLLGIFGLIAVVLYEGNNIEQTFQIHLNDGLQPYMLRESGTVIKTSRKNKNDRDELIHDIAHENVKRRNETLTKLRQPEQLIRIPIGRRKFPFSMYIKE